MKRALCILSINMVMSLGLWAQQSRQTQFLQITTMESTVSGGAGRSRMFITNSDGNQHEKEMSNLFSLVGINLKNIKNNEVNIVQTLQSYTDAGWQIVSVTPLTISPSEGGQSSGMFMTRYLLFKEQ